MQVSTARRRACITGFGALSAIGHSAAALWEGLLAGRCGLEPIRSFDTAGVSIARAGEVKDFQPETRLSPAEIRRFDRIHQFGLFATREALEDGHLNLGRIDPSRVGVILATSVGGMMIGEDYQHSQTHGGPFVARRLFDFPYYATGTTLARVLGVRGPAISPSIACASGTATIGMALDFIRLGYADVFVVGGAETVCSFVVNGFNCLRATTADVVRPFDARRAGLLVGEGAAVLIVEERAHARARGARIDVEVVGAGLAGDATHMAAPARDGAGAARAMRMALREARVTAPEIDFISAHGTGTVYNDAMEIAAITSVFGEAAARIPVNSIKGALGHTLAAAGTFEAIMCAQVLRTGMIPATLNCEQPDPSCGVDLVVGVPRRHAARTVLSTSSAFAGNNAAIVLRREV